MKRVLGSMVCILAVSAGCSAADNAEQAPASEEGELNSSTVSLRIPILSYDGKHPLLSTHNAEFKKLGLTEVPDTILLESNSKGEPTAASRKQFRDIMDLVVSAQEKDSKVEMVQLAEPSDYVTKSSKTNICYKGNPLLVVPFIQRMADSVFSDQLVVHGWKYKQKVVTEISEEDQANLPDVWNEWRGKGQAVLVLTASSDGGEEANVGIIPKCK